MPKNKQAEDEPQDDPKPEDNQTTEPEKDQKPADSTPSNDGTPKGYVTEESYQGLQRVVSKKDKELEDLKARQEQLATELEELKANSKSSEEKTGDLETKLQESQKSLEAAEAERGKLNTQLTQQGIVMSEFPELAPLAGFIPIAEDEEGFRENAKSFQEAIGTYTKQAVKNTLSGAAPPSGDGGLNNEMLTTAEEDKLWDEVYLYAGVPGKEKEYAEANQRLQEVLNAKNQ
jgi:hypothetical protein